MAWNSHAGSYTWKGLVDGQFRPLDMTLTLEQNNVHDEADEFERLSIKQDFYFPVLHLYFNDDLTVAWDTVGFAWRSDILVNIISTNSRMEYVSLML